MEFVILTGLSGAGKTHALQAMEDLNFYCVDNIPPVLLRTFYELCEKSTDSRMKKVAVVADIRGGEVIDVLAQEIRKLRVDGKQFKMLFLDAKADVLLIRYKETRRKHPLVDSLSNSSTEDALALERELMKIIKEMSDYVIDTSYMETKLLKERVTTIFVHGSNEGMIITCMSFGFKYGIPLEADLVIDVRCLANPFYVKELKHLTGLDEPVREYILKYEESQIFIEKLLGFLDYAASLYKKEGKSEVVVGIGCTGGKHRSVTIARLINSHFVDKGQKSSIHHRDIWKA